MAAAVKYPKSMGACADMLYVMRSKRLAADKVAADLKATEQALIEHIINTMPKDDAGGVGKTHMVRVVTKQKPQVKDWPVFYAYVAKTKSFDMLQKRLSEQAVQDRLDDGKKLPGVELFNAVTVSLTKV